ncbi:50S ribosomal protein L11 [Methanococcus voltae]|jgi:large subunit ribosomal protein L11|uniref:Large ribosomal subunit protein uL11 n=2 Tax=Methanococcus voltae TaxID=2188 RepID=A0A8J7S1S5_METVO|nr:50S ribosomal protein L11 [Methanococcus voltae]MBP2172790.1 large subunit ribosomal protein L11 [Methanococcus voltae]MBP2201800.1 large subunit ribosomal protein L11 [Methanococcus voltae]MCS3922624.1 large subunit ribosomal protein L11 [Methanococcus voltae PS]
MAEQVVEILVTGGKATAGPPLGPAIGPLGVNIMQVVNEINQKTASYEGMSVPVSVIVDTEKRSFKVEVGIPPASALIMKELGIEKAAQEPKHQVAGNLTMEQVVKIANMKYEAMLSYNVKNASKEVIGTCVSLGVNVEGKTPREAQKAIDAGEFDSFFN